MKILIIEDEPKTASYLRRGLSEHGFVIDVAERGDEGLHLAQSGGYDAILLDVMLPGRDGWSILAALRTEACPTTGVVPDGTRCSRRSSTRPRTWRR